MWDKINDDVADFQFGFFADAIVAVGLKGLFQSAGPFTVFAPTNRAWYSALVSLGVTKEACSTRALSPTEPVDRRDLPPDELPRGLTLASSLCLLCRTCSRIPR